MFSVGVLRPNEPCEFKSHLEERAAWQPLLCWYQMPLRQDVGVVDVLHTTVFLCRTLMQPEVILSRLDSNLRQTTRKEEKKWFVGILFSIYV